MVALLLVPGRRQTMVSRWVAVALALVAVLLALTPAVTAFKRRGSQSIRLPTLRDYQVTVTLSCGGREVGRPGGRP